MPDKKHACPLLEEEAAATDQQNDAQKQADMLKTLALLLLEGAGCILTSGVGGTDTST